MKEGLHPASNLDPAKHARTIKRPRLVINCEASIVQEMHELAWKTGRSVSSLAESAMADLLADFAAGRTRIKPEADPGRAIGNA